MIDPTKTEDILYCRHCEYFNPTEVHNLQSGVEKHTCLNCHKHIFTLTNIKNKHNTEIYDPVRRSEKSPIEIDEMLDFVSLTWKKCERGYVLVNQKVLSPKGKRKRV